MLAAVLFAAVAVTTGAASSATDTRIIQHVLNRVAFGPQPGDVERVRRMGVTAYIDQQLHPERLRDAGVEQRLTTFETLTLDSRTIAERYEIPALRARLAQQRAEGVDASADAPASQAQKLARRPEQQRANLPLVELSQQKMLRAIYSERQLEEVLTDFWFNHFNVDARKGPSRFMLTEYERDVIRPHVLGRFRDLLEATAKSPAMLFYLDNWMSATPEGASVNQAQSLRRRASTSASPGRRAGLNENYGRELLELHTLGVDGGYTQKDVTEVARAFTGWTINRPRAGGSFRFAPALHDDGEKVVLGHRIRAGGGQRDGEEVLDILASHPSTARFISRALARRFVSDHPPESLIDRMAATFSRTDGDLRAVMQVLLTSREFLGTDAMDAKVKTPFEFVVSAVRATGAEVSDARALVRSVQQLGMPLYQCQPPTGYADAASAWMNTGALVSRMNAALALASGRLPGVTLPDIPDAPALVATNLTEPTRATIARAQAPAQAIALALGSPEFQRR
ncbi:MAG: DUF1800 domain-containing protein [Vicinamibacterales bacterium]